jgi:hypothetical protein
LSTFGDSPPTGVLFAVESWLMSQGTLLRGSRVRNRFWALDQDLPMRTQWRSRSKSLGCEFINFDPTNGFPCGFLGFFLGSRVGSGFSLASPSLEGTSTGSGGRVTC